MSTISSIDHFFCMVPNPVAMATGVLSGAASPLSEPG